MRENILNINVSDKVSYFELNDHKTRNALSYELIDSLIKALELANDNDDIHVVVLKSAGKVFSSGGDIKQMKDQSGMFGGSGNELYRKYLRGIQKIPRAIENFEKPIIAALDGAAIGAGADLAFMCDIRLGTKNTRFAESFVNLGLISGDGGSYFLNRLVGYQKALELSLTGRNVEAKEALEIGLLNHIIEDNFNEFVHQYAKSIAAKSLLCTRMIKSAYKSLYPSDLNTHLELMAAYQGHTQLSKEHRNAIDDLVSKSKTYTKPV